jgi:hypothetical protein
MRKLCLLLAVCAACGKKPAPKQPSPPPAESTEPKSGEPKPEDGKPRDKPQKFGDPCDGGEKPR